MRTLRSGAILLGVLSVLFSSMCLVAAQQPSDSDVETVKKLIGEDLAKANIARDLNALLSHYAEDAKIDSIIAKGKVSKEQYAEAMAKNFASPGRVSYVTENRVTKVSFQDSTHATVIGEIILRAAGGSQSASHEWMLVKRDGRWLIVETK